MDHLKELLDLALRWLHLIAGIMWVGNSMLFNWLDRNLLKPSDAKPGFEGEIWMVHSGGFYQVEKKQLEPHQMPSVLHWFKWQSYITWMSGISLLALVYYASEGFLVDPSVSKLTHAQGMMVGASVMVGGFVTYDLLWRSPLAKLPKVLTTICFLLLAGVIVLLTQLLSGRAAYIHLGAMLGTLMSGNVFFHIIPSQNELVRATREGRPQEGSLGLHAKQRSIHNNYMTFPVLFIMISNHFPSTYGNQYNYLILAIIAITGATIRHFMNIRFWFRQWLIGFIAAVVIGSVGVFVLVNVKPKGGIAASSNNDGPLANFKTVQTIVRDRCVQCHSATPTDEVWKAAPVGVMLDSPEQIKQHAERIKARVVVGKTMPLANKTHMTDEERELMSRWIYQGAKLK